MKGTDMPTSLTEGGGVVIVRYEDGSCFGASYARADEAKRSFLGYMAGSGPDIPMRSLTLLTGAEYREWAWTPMDPDQRYLRTTLTGPTVVAWDED
jgi:hypothetical protein